MRSRFLFRGAVMSGVIYAALGDPSWAAPAAFLWVLFVETPIMVSRCRVA
jgi:hypothetical protein